MSGVPTALLALHYQNEVLHPDGLIRVGIADDEVRTAVIEHASQLLTEARRRDWLIVHVRIAFRPDYADLPRNIPIFLRTETLGAVKDGEWGAEFYASLAPRASRREFAVKHTSISAFRGTSLDQLLRAHGIVRVVAAGVATHSVVEGTVREAAESGYEVSVAADACAATPRSIHDASLASMSLMARIITVQALIDAEDGA